MTVLSGKPPERVSLTISIDTEEDNWVPATTGITNRNIGELPSLARLFTSLGVRPTFFTTYQVAHDPEAAAVLRDLHARGDVEVGAHLHPWNCPPASGLESEASMLRAYPLPVQRAKIGHLLAAIREGIGVDARSFRAGRFGIGKETIQALLDEGIRVDSSVTPLISWAGYEGGASFLDAPLDPYELDGVQGVCHPRAGGAMLELPVTVGYTRFSRESWPAIARLQENPVVRRLRIAGLASKLARLDRVILTPEAHGADEMLNLTRHLLDHGVGYLHMYFHSNSLLPGLTPFTRSESEVDRVYGRIQRYVEGLTALVDVTFLTASEVAQRWRSGREEGVEA